MPNAPKKNTEFSSSIQFDTPSQTPLILGYTTLFYRCNNDKKWTLNFVSNSCEELFGYTREKFLSHSINFGDLIVESDKDMIWNTVQAAINSQCKYELLYHMSTAEQTTKIIYEQGEALYDQYGKLVELVGFLSDITNHCSACTQNYLPLLEKCALEMNALASKNKINRGLTLRLLSHREIETIVLLCKGKSMKEIAIDMNISPRTVEMHLAHARVKLHCNSQSELRNIFYKSDAGLQLLVTFRCTC